MISLLQVVVIYEDYHRSCYLLYHWLGQIHRLRIGDGFLAQSLPGYLDPFLVKKYDKHFLIWRIVISGDKAY